MLNCQLSQNNYNPNFKGFIQFRTAHSAGALKNGRNRFNDEVLTLLETKGAVILSSPITSIQVRNRQEPYWQKTMDILVTHFRVYITPDKDIETLQELRKLECADLKFEECSFDKIPEKNIDSIIKGLRLWKATVYDIFENKKQLI